MCLQATGPSAEPPVLATRSSNAQPAAGTGTSGKAPVAWRLAPTGSQKGKPAAGAGSGSGVADDDDEGLAAGTLSKEDAKQTLLQLFGEGEHSWRPAGLGKLSAVSCCRDSCCVCMTWQGLLRGCRPCQGNSNGQEPQLGTAT